MKISKLEALKTLNDAALAEYLMYCSGLVDPAIHLYAYNLFQRLENIAKNSTLQEFEGVK